jgi:seryl-tRNA synthetase
MIEIQIIRQSPELVKQKLSVKNFSDLHLVDEILQADEERRAIQKQLDDIRSRENAIAKEIGVLFKEGKKMKQKLKSGNSELERGERYINESLCRNGKKTIRFVSSTTEPSVRFGPERKNG